MKRYLAFAYYEDFAQGGAFDLIGHSNNIQSAVDMAIKAATDKGNKFFWQVLDTETETLIADQSYADDGDEQCRAKTLTGLNLAVCAESISRLLLTDNRPRERSFMHDAATEKRFHGSKEALKHLEAVRWSNGITCPLCGSSRGFWTPLQSRRRGHHRCHDCHREFSVLTGTAMHGSRIEPQVWLRAVHLMLTTPGGVGQSELMKVLGVSIKTAGNMLNRLCKELGIERPDKRRRGSVMIA